MTDGQNIRHKAILAILAILWYYLTRDNVKSLYGMFWEYLHPIGQSIADMMEILFIMPSIYIGKLGIDGQIDIYIS